ncbi:MAG: glycosyltransferase family 2 protein [Chloroflexota bacterium]|nr:glycosyltransferase family 2 protein [Chloroflexota bacterium]
MTKLAAAEPGATGRDGDQTMSRRATPIAFVSVVLPCLNEAAAVTATVAEARRGLAATGLPGEVLVVDNGSSDDSIVLASAAGARVVREPSRGYGAAIAAGIAAARGDVIIMADADHTYDLERLGGLLAPLTTGADLVIGTRLQGAIAAGAMPGWHRYLGTPVLTTSLAIAAGVRVSDSQSGYRAFRRETMLGLGLRARGMEFASEMLLRAGRAGLTVVEVPVDYRVRVGESKLSPLGDGWRHVHLLMLLTPHLSLIVPGILATLVGLALSLISLVATTGIEVGSVRWLPVFLGPMLLILGVQAGFLGCLAAHRSALTPARVRRRLTWLDRPDAIGRLLGGFALLAGLGILIDAGLLLLWLAGRSGPELLGVAGLAQALIVIGGGGMTTLFAAGYLER